MASLVLAQEYTSEGILEDWRSNLLAGGLTLLQMPRGFENEVQKFSARGKNAVTTLYKSDEWLEHVVVASLKCGPVGKLDNIDFCGNTFFGWPYCELLTQIQRSVLDPRCTPDASLLKPYSDHVQHSFVVDFLGEKILRYAAMPSGKRLHEYAIQGLQNCIAAPESQVALEGLAKEFAFYCEKKHNLSISTSAFCQQLLLEPNDLFKGGEECRQTDLETLCQLWHLTALYHDVGYHIAAINDILCETEPDHERGLHAPVYNCFRRQEMSSFVAATQLRDVFAAFTPFGTQEVKDYTKQVAGLRSLDLSSEDYNEYLFLVLGNLHPYWSVQELLRTASDLFSGQYVKISSTMQARRVFQKVILFALAASSVVGHHIFSMGSLRNRARQYRDAPPSVRGTLESVVALQNSLSTTHFCKWPLGFLLHLIDSCEVFSRIRFEQAEPEVGAGQERCIRIRISESGHTGSIHVVSPYKDACVGIIMPGGSRFFSSPRNTFVRRSLSRVPMDVNSDCGNLARIEFRLTQGGG